MLFFSNLVDETQMSKPPKATRHHNDQCWSIFVKWIIKNPIFLLILAPFLSEAVEASRCHFFENWLMKHKFPHLLKPLGTMIQ